MVLQMQIIPLIQDVQTVYDIIKGLGIAGLALVASIWFAKWITAQSLEKIESENKESREANIRLELRIDESHKIALEANQRTELSQKEFKEFLQNELTENRLAITRLTDALKAHIESKEKAFNIIENLMRDKVS
jgi:hypothetical protein